MVFFISKCKLGVQGKTLGLIKTDLKIPACYHVKKKPTCLMQLAESGQFLILKAVGIQGPG